MATLTRGGASVRTGSDCARQGLRRADLGTDVNAEGFAAEAHRQSRAVAVVMLPTTTRPSWIQYRSGLSVKRAEIWTVSGEPTTPANHGLR